MILFCNLPLALIHTHTHTLSNTYKILNHLLAHFYSQIFIKYTYKVFGILLITIDRKIKKIEQSLPSQSFLLYTVHRNNYKSLHTVHFS